MELFSAAAARTNRHARFTAFIAFTISIVSTDRRFNRQLEAAVKIPVKISYYRHTFLHWHPPNPSAIDRPIIKRIARTW